MLTCTSSKLGWNWCMMESPRPACNDLTHFPFSLSDISDLKIWTSNLRRTHQTAAVVLGPRTQIAALDELSAGFMDGLTYGDVERSYPQEYMAREKDKLRYKYPGGTSKNSLGDTPAGPIDVT
jgi:broad specificity phosphatase PhoE